MAAPGFDAQHAIRLQAGELDQYMKEVFGWSKSMKQREAERKRDPGASQAALPPVRGRAAEAAARSEPTVAVVNAAAASSSQPRTGASQARHPAAHTYDHYRDKWDKFDVDAALADDEVGERTTGSSRGAGGASGNASGNSSSSSAPRQQHQGSGGGSSSRGSRAIDIPQARVTVPVAPSKQRLTPAGTSAAPTTAEGWKDAGNAHFKAGRYTQAVDCYSRSLQLEPGCLAFANRAMAQLKLGRHALAEADCNEALQLDPTYVKAYQRRATARRQRGNLLGAVEDSEMALRLEPNNKQAAADRAAFVQQLLQQQGLQPPSTTQRMQVLVAAPDVAPMEVESAAAAGAEAGSGDVGGFGLAAIAPDAGDALIKVSSEQRQKVPSAITAAAGGPAAPAAAVIQVANNGEEESIPELAEQDHGAQQQQQQQQQSTSQHEAEQQPDSMTPEQPRQAPPAPPAVADVAAAASAGQQVAAPGRAMVQEIAGEQQQPALETAAAAAVENVAAAEGATQDVEMLPAAASDTAEVAAQQLPHTASTCTPAVTSALAATGKGSAAAPAASSAPAVAAAVHVVAPRPASAAAAASFRVPRTGLDFEKAWKGLKGDQQQQAAYLLALQPAQLPALLKQALNPALLAAAAAALLQPAVMQQRPAAAVALLQGLTQVPRFDINLLSVPPRHKAELRSAWDAAHAELAPADARLADTLAALRQKYKL